MWEKEEKTRRRVRVEEFQEEILDEINVGLLWWKFDPSGERRSGGKYHGRIRFDKLVLSQSEGAHLGELVNLSITRASPMSLPGGLTFICIPEKTTGGQQNQSVYTVHQACEAVRMS